MTLRGGPGDDEIDRARSGLALGGPGELLARDLNMQACPATQWAAHRERAVERRDAVAESTQTAALGRVGPGRCRRRCTGKRTSNQGPRASRSERSAGALRSDDVNLCVCRRRTGSNPGAAHRSTRSRSAEGTRARPPAMHLESPGATRGDQRSACSPPDPGREVLARTGRWLSSPPTRGAGQ